MRTPLISIGMPVYNCERTVGEAIASILNQTFADWELMVYDDGSRDGTVAAARQFADPRVVVVAADRNRGLPTCLNQIVSSCGSEYFARMDGDDIAYPDRLQSQLDFLRMHRDVDLVGGSMLVFRGDGAALGVRRGPVTHDRICAHPCSGIPMAHPTWMGRSEWFRRNPYHAGMVRMEDRELLFRTWRYSRFANLPQVVLGYREDSLSLRKILIARRQTCRTLLGSVGNGHSPWHAASAVAGQVARSLLDVAAVGSNLDYRLLRHRVPPALPDEVAAWQSVFERTQDKVREQTIELAAASGDL